MRKILCVLLSVLLVCGFTLSVSATTSVELAVPQIQQVQGSNWCWAACGASTVNYLTSYTITQQDFYTNTTKLSIYDYSKSALCSEVLVGLKYYGLNGTYTNHMTVGSSQLLSMSQISNQLSADMPIFALKGRYTDLGIAINIGHYYLIRGCIDGNTVLSDYVSLMDPDTGSYVLMSYSSWCDSTSAYWHATIYNIA